MSTPSFEAVSMEFLFLLLLILVNGLFAMSEIAVVSSRKTRLQQWADDGKAGAGAALELAAEPGHFLSAIQVGITLIGIFSGAFGEATIAAGLSVGIARVPALAPHAQTIALTAVVVGITFVSLILGELVPKRIALRNPEGIAVTIARPMRLLAKVAHPLVWFLSFTTESVLKLLGVRPASTPNVTEEEIKVMMEQGAEAGVFEEEEQQLVANVFRLDRQKVEAIMTPRVDVVYLDVEDSRDDTYRKILDNAHTVMPVCRGGIVNVLGIVHAKDLLRRSLSGEQFDLLSSLKSPLFVPETATAMTLLEMFKKSGRHMAFVVDEYGDAQGLVTTSDVLESIVGDIPSEGEPAETSAVRREDGSWLLDGMLPMEKFGDLFPDVELPEEESGSYHTLSGFILMRLRRIPAVADHFTWHGWRFEVMDMDGNRIDKVLASPVPQK
jgi:putative hemolysin